MNPIFILIIYATYKLGKFIWDSIRWKDSTTQVLRVIDAFLIGYHGESKWEKDMHTWYGYKYDPWYPILKKNGKLTSEEHSEWMNWARDNL